MRDPLGASARDVVAGGLETFAGARESRAAPAPALWTRPRNAIGSQAAETSRAMGRGIPQILGGIARSPGRVFGENSQTIRKKGKEIMCPACLANIALLAVGAISSGGLTAFALRKFSR